jgi:phosphoinositide-3-kinase regulatory subunit 4
MPLKKVLSSLFMCAITSHPLNSGLYVYVCLYVYVYICVYVMKGYVHGWDLRGSLEAFNFYIRPELGFTTAIAVDPDRNWLIIGTSRGYLTLWDIRFNIMSKLWRHSSHSPIHKIVCLNPLPRNRGDVIPVTDGAYVFVAAGNNETAVWGLPEGGECFKCFRSMTVTGQSLKESYAELPRLETVSIPSRHNSLIPSALSSIVAPMRLDEEFAVKSIVGNISQKGSSYLITAGTDRHIRFWDFMTPARCLTISGLEQAQPKPCYETPSVEGLFGKLYVCLDANIPSADIMLRAHLPLRESRGILPASSNHKVKCITLHSFPPQH